MEESTGQDMNYVDNEVGFYGYNNSDVNGDGELMART